MNQVTKHNFQGLNTDFEHRFLQDGDYIFLENGRVGSSQEDNQGAVENIKGNLQIAFSMPTGTNTCIGSVEDTKANTLLYMVWHNLDNHSILKFDDGSISKVAGGSILAFPDSPITGITTIDNYLIWTDNVNPPRFIDVDNADASVTESQLQLYPSPPALTPLATRNTDVNINSNLISNTNFQFAYRFEYLDGARSVFSPLSILSKADQKPVLFGSANNNWINVFVTIESALLGPISFIEVAYRENNSGSYNVYDRIATDGGQFYNSPFYNDTIIETVPDSVSSKLVENIPIKTKALEIIKSRLFMSKDLDGYDIDESTFGLNLSIDKVAQATDQMYVKGGGSYNVGLIFYDPLSSRPSTVMGVQQINIPDVPVTSSTASFTVGHQPGPTAPRIRVDISGIPPIHANNYRLAVSENNFSNSYAQFPVNPLFYKFDTPEIWSNTSNSVDIAGKVFYKNKPTALNQSGNTPATQVYLQMPTNLPIVPNTSYYVKFITMPWIDPVPILAVDGDKIIIGLMGLTDFSALPNQWLIEIFSIKESKDNIMFEGAATHGINAAGEAGRSFGTTQIVFGLDTHYVDAQRSDDTEFVFNPLLPDYTKPNDKQVNYDNPDEPNVILKAAINYTLMLNADASIESPTPSFDRIGLTEIEADTEIRGIVQIITGTENSSSWVLDYTKIAGDFGRPNVKDDGFKQEDLSDTIVFSNPYIQNSRANGFRTFDTLDEHTLPANRGGINTLKKVGDVLLAIHPTETTTMYVGEGFIRQGEDAVLAKTTSVIGDDRELVGNFGTKHPASFAEWKGQGFYWDATQGAVIRYTREGLFPISNRFMENYFRGKIGGFDRDKEAVAIVDSFHSEYIITFPFSGDTWAFHIPTERWVYKAAFFPAYYGRVGKSLFSIHLGQLWEHNVNPIYNNFYGVQFERTLRLVIHGKFPSEVKAWQAIRIESKDLGGSGTDLVATFTNEDGQETHLIASNISSKEGIFSGPIYMDRNTPVFTDSDQAQYYGDKMRGQVLVVELVNNRTDISPLYFVNVLHKTSPPIYQ